MTSAREADGARGLTAMYSALLLAGGGRTLMSKELLGAPVWDWE